MLYGEYNPPTPAASRGSASEEALLATRGEKRKFAGPVLRAGKVKAWS